MSETQLSTAIEDHALDRVPDHARQGWLALSWNTAGIVTSLVQLFLGALVCFVAGYRIALAAGVFVTVVGALLGWACGHVAYRSGLSSTVLSRHFGFGRQGSIISSLIFAFMIIGFLALENALLYKGFLFYFHLSDTLTSRIVIYGLLSLAWVLLTAYGFALVARVSSITLVAFLAVLAYITYVVVTASAHPGADLLSFGSQFPAQALQAMGATTPVGKFVFCVNVLIGSAGALALVDADLGRYARSSLDIGVAALIGNVMMDIVMLSMGGLLYEFGVTFAKGKKALLGEIEPTLEALSTKLPRMVLESLRQQVARIKALGKDIATMGDPGALDSGSACEFCGWLGLVPRQWGMGGKVRRQGISKRGDSYLRTLLIHGARSVLHHAKEPGPWLEQIQARRPANVVIVAQAAKMARTIWAVTARQQSYQRGYRSVRPLAV